MIIVRSPLAPKGGSKTQNGRFPSQIALRWRTATKFLCEKTVSNKLVRHSLA